MNQSADGSRRVITRRLFVAQVCLVGIFGVLALLGYRWPALLGSLWFGIFLGALGGSIALLRRVRSENPAMLAELAGDTISTLMPLLYGGLMAGIAYLLFMSGILSGDGGAGLFTSNLFPNFTTPPIGADELLSVRQFVEMRPASLKDFGKVLVWCFVAGYSERFVTGILKQLERTGHDKPEV